MQRPCTSSARLSKGSKCGVVACGAAAAGAVRASSGASGAAAGRAHRRHGSSKGSKGAGGAGAASISLSPDLTIICCVPDEDEEEHDLADLGPELFISQVQKASHLNSSASGVATRSSSGSLLNHQAGAWQAARMSRPVWRTAVDDASHVTDGGAGAPSARNSGGSQGLLRSVATSAATASPGSLSNASTTLAATVNTAVAAATVTTSTGADASSAAVRGSALSRLITKAQSLEQLQHLHSLHGPHMDALHVANMLGRLPAAAAGGSADQLQSGCQHLPDSLLPLADALCGAALAQLDRLVRV